MKYLEETNQYYSQIKLGEEIYSRIYPNEEEACRASVIISYLSIVRSYYPTANLRILDLGCGRGWLSNLMSAFGKCEGIDPSAGAIEYAREHFPQVAFHLGTLEDLLGCSDFEPYDVVVSSEVIEHVPATHKRLFVEQISKALKDKGHCILTTPRGDLYRAWQRRKGFSPQVIEDWLSEKQVKALFTRCGFQVVAHSRTRPMPLSRIGRLMQARQVKRMLSCMRLSALRASLEYVNCIYQVWWFTKTASPNEGK